MISPTMPGGRASRSASVGARGLGLVVLMGYREGSTRSRAAADRHGTFGADGQPACAREPSTLARVGAGGELLDLTEGDIRLWMFWVGLDYILHR